MNAVIVNMLHELFNGSEHKPLHTEFVVHILHVFVYAYLRSKTLQEWRGARIWVIHEEFGELLHDDAVDRSRERHLCVIHMWLMTISM